MWEQWVNGILGVWLVISPFLGLSPNAMTTNLVIVGILVAIFGFVGAGQTQHVRNSQHQHA